MADFDINSILSSLSQEDIENLKKTAADIMGGMGNQPPKKDSSIENKTNENDKNKGNSNSNNVNNMSYENILSSFQNLNGNSFGLPDMNMLSSLAPVLQAVNSKDERVEFINALRPLLSDERQKRADEAVKRVRLLSLLPLLKERGLM